MDEFKITLARIEAFGNRAQDKNIRVVFHIERGSVGFDAPVYLQSSDFDDTEVMQAARNSLFRMFDELARQSKVWELSAAELERLSIMKLDPVG